jgi:hypothetical protein
MRKKNKKEPSTVCRVGSDTAALYNKLVSYADFKGKNPVNGEDLSNRTVLDFVLNKYFSDTARDYLGLSDEQIKEIKNQTKAA